jgi:DNA-binding HxlR family transcriptional regulator
VPTTRSYQDQCGIARALDVLGERWSLLIVRELLLGPQRFSELRRVLANTSSNIIADRLRELEANGVIRRRQIPAPAASWVYELTPWGRELEPIVLALGLWGLTCPRPPAPAVLGPTTVLLYLRTRACPEPGDPPATVVVELEGQAWTIQSGEGEMAVHVGQAPTADATLRTSPSTLMDLIGAPAKLRSAIHSGAATVSGDQERIRRLLQQVRPADRSAAVNQR